VLVELLWWHHAAGRRRGLAPSGPNRGCTRRHDQIEIGPSHPVNGVEGRAQLLGTPFCECHGTLEPTTGGCGWARTDSLADLWRRLGPCTPLRWNLLAGFQFWCGATALSAVKLAWPALVAARNLGPGTACSFPRAPCVGQDAQKATSLSLLSPSPSSRKHDESKREETRARCNARRSQCVLVPRSNGPS